MKKTYTLIHHYFLEYKWGKSSTEKSNRFYSVHLLLMKLNRKTGYPTFKSNLHDFLG